MYHYNDIERRKEMKAENEQELLTGLKIMRSHLDILIENLENKTKYNNKNLIRNITLDLRELYESYYLRGEKK